MKYRKPIKQYLILFICLTLLGACSKGVLLDDLTNKGTEESPIMYYEGELFNGVGISLHDDGQLYVECNYKSGKRDGLYREFYSNDEFFSLIDSQIDDWNYDYDDFKKKQLNRKTITQIRESGECLNYILTPNTDPKVNGWHEDDQLKVEKNYKDGEVNGLFKKWHINGQIKSYINIVDGKRNGLFLTWFNNG